LPCAGRFREARTASFRSPDSRTEIKQLEVLPLSGESIFLMRQ
jgi:hypothetical protein